MDITPDAPSLQIVKPIFKTCQAIIARNHARHADKIK